MTKTGFVNAHIDKTNTKYYKYHGIIKPCNIQPNPDPGIVYPQKPPGPGWELIWDTDFYYNGIFRRTYQAYDFLPSSDFDPCPQHFPDYKKRYYFCELHYVKVYWAVPLWIAWPVYEACNTISFMEPGTYAYKAWFGELWAGADYVFMVAYPVAGSHYKIWRSTTGELPSYYPIPEDFYYY